MRPERAVIPNDIVRYSVSCFAEAYVARHRHPFVLQAPEEALHWAIDAPMSRGGDLHVRDPIKSVGKARGQCNVLDISEFLWSIALRQFVSRHRFSFADHYAYVPGLSPLSQKKIRTKSPLIKRPLPLHGRSV